MELFLDIVWFLYMFTVHVLAALGGGVLYLVREVSL